LKVPLKSLFLRGFQGVKNDPSLSKDVNFPGNLASGTPLSPLGKRRTFLEELS